MAERLEEIKARLKKATEGDWEFVGSDLECKSPSWKVVFSIDRESCCNYGCCGGHSLDWDNEEADQAFIANAKDDIAYLLKLLEDHNAKKR